MSKITQYISAFFEPLNSAQRMLFGLFSMAILVGLGFLFYWAMQPSYTMLFSSLPAESAQEIVEELESMGVNYKLENGGSTIMVPQSKVYNLRLKFASEGHGSISYKGYEIFDNNALGMTDFMQRVNKKRALEGELARTINSLSQVSSSRIHLVLPERTPFQQTSVEPSASVILDLKGNQTLSNSQVQSIAKLVSGSVEGLNPDKVVILDENGNRLTENIRSEDEWASATSEMKIRQEAESYLTHKGQTMLDQVLGPGNSILRISTRHDFDRVTRESNLIDPDSRVVLSEEERTEATEDVHSEPITVDQFTPIEQRTESIVVSEKANESSTVVRNYEFNKIHELYEKSVGEITQVTASVLMDYKRETVVNPDGTTTIQQVPHTQEDIQEIEQIMANVLGISAERGDRLTVTQIKFQEPSVQPDSQGFFLEGPLSYEQLFRWLLLAAALITVLVIVYRMTRRFEVGLVPMDLNYQAEVIDGAEGRDAADGRYITDAGGESSAGDIYKNKLSPQAQKQIEDHDTMSEEITEFIRGNSKEAANVVRSLMTSESRQLTQGSEKPAEEAEQLQADSDAEAVNGEETENNKEAGVELQESEETESVSS